MYGSTIGKQLLLCATDIHLKHPSHDGQDVQAKIELPDTFTAFIKREEDRYIKYEQWMMETGVQTLVDMCNVYRQSVTAAKNEKK